MLDIFIMSSSRLSEKIFWRSRRDSNSRTTFAAYSLSRGTPWASWVLLHMELVDGFEPPTCWLLVPEVRLELTTHPRDLGSDPQAIPFCHSDKSAALPTELHQHIMSPWNYGNVINTPNTNSRWRQVLINMVYKNKFRRQAPNLINFHHKSFVP